MASFTDNPQLLGSFNPYIQTLPVDDMVRTSLIKQEQFNAGISKVQGWVDTLSGLPIAKDEVKNYVQTRLGQLKEGVTKNLAGDFSDMRITNQIGGAAKTIARDPIVNNAVQSTARMQAAQSQMQEAIKAGKSAPENEWVLQNSISSWINDGQLETSFNGSYTPYTDVVGEVIKMYKDLPDSENLDRDAFRTAVGPDGKEHVVYNSTLIKGKSAERLKSVINLVTGRPDVQRQMNITGEYKYQGIDVNTMGRTLQSSTQASLNAITKRIQSFQSKLATDLSANKEIINQNIAALKNQEASLKSDYEESVGMLASNNLSGVKAKLVKQGISSNFINAYTTESAVENPMWSAYMKEADQKLDRDKFVWQQYDDNRNFDLKELEFDLKKLEAAAKLTAKKEKEEGDVDYQTSPGVVDESKGKVSRDTYIQATDDLKSRRDQEYRRQANIIAGMVGGDNAIPPPYRQDGTPNISSNPKTGYPDKASADAMAEKLIKDSAGGMVNGKPSSAAKIAFNTLRDYDDAISVREGAAKEQEEEYNSVVFKATGQRPSTPQKDMLKGFGKELTEDQKAKQNEKAKHGIRPTGFPDNPEVRAAMQKREEGYKRMQLQSQAPTVQFKWSKEAERLDIKHKFDDVVRLATTGKASYRGDADELSDVLDEQKQQSLNNNYYAQFDENTNKGRVWVQQGTKSYPIEDIPAYDFFKIFPQLQVDNQFDKMFGNRMTLTGGRTTDVRSAGRADPIYLDAPANPYPIQYHIVEGSSPETYQIKLWVLNPINPTGDPIINGEMFDNGDPNTAKMTKSQVMGVINLMKDRNKFELYLGVKGKLPK